MRIKISEHISPEVIHVSTPEMYKGMLAAMVKSELEESELLTPTINPVHKTVELDLVALSWASYEKIREMLGEIINPETNYKEKDKLGQEILTILIEGQ